MSDRHLHLVCYDVRCPRRLARVLRVVKAWSTGGQKSVHECWLTDAERRLLVGQLRAEIDRRVDRLMLVRPEPGVRTLGIAVAPRDPRWLYVG
jgi:CRISPR-associated protein Cas2